MICIVKMKVVTRKSTNQFSRYIKVTLSKPPGHFVGKLISFAEVKFCYDDLFLVIELI